MGVTFNYTGVVQTYTIPATANYVIECYGARGNHGKVGGTDVYGGNGGYVKGTIALSQGTVVYVYVGGGDAFTSSPGFNGGGAGNNPNAYYCGGGGGGASDVRIGGQALPYRVLVAGGGGGAADGGEVYAGYVLGGFGGYPSGAAVTLNSSPNAVFSQGGTQTFGGSGGNYAGWEQGSSGSSGQGGQGVNASASWGGGGGGYYGGGGGTWCAGGGGSSWYKSSVISNFSYNNGTNNATGKVVISTANNKPNAPTNLVPNTNVFKNPVDSQNFSFTYSDQESNACSAYRISYREVGTSTYTQTAWISNTTASGGTITHTFAANTFAVDKNYEWYAEVKDSEGAASAASSNSTFNTTATPTVTIASPTGGGKKNAKIDIECTWTYSSPISSAQSKYQLQVLQGGSVVYDSGEVSSAATSHIIPANALPYVGDPVCTTKLKVLDSAGHYSLWSTLGDNFIAFQPYNTTGSWLSPVIDNTGRSVPAIVTYDVTLPTGTTVTIAIRKSDDNVTWSDWTDISSGATVSTHRYIQVRATLTSSSDGLNTASLNSISIAYADQYYTSGTWLSPELNFSELIISAANLAHSEVLNNGSVVFETRSKNASDGTWSAWAAPFTTKDNIMQIRATISSAASLLTTPEITSIQATVDPTAKQSLWVSQSVDVSQATNLNASKALMESLLHSGQILLYSRSKANIGDGWSDWSISLYDGTLTHPANKYIQLFVQLVGDAEVTELTLSLDGDASVDVLKTGMTPGAEYSFATLNNMALIVNGDDLPLKWDAVTAPATLGTDPPVLSMITTHHNKAWGVDTECSSRVRYSNILDPTKWDAYAFIDFNPDDGDQITSIIRYGQNLIVSKLRSMAMLTGNKSTNYNVSWLDSEAGAAGKNAMCIADKYVVYVSQDGIRFTDLSQSIVATERLIPSWEGINKRRLNQAACVYWKNKCYVALPSEGSLHNDTVWVYDFLRNSWSIINGWNVSYWKTFNQYGEEILLSGSSIDGQLHTVDVTEYDDAIPVTFEWRSKDFNFKTPEKYKLFRNIFVDIEGVAETTNLEIDLIVDGVTTGTYTTIIPAGAEMKTTRRILPPIYGAVLGAAIGLKVRGRCCVQGITIEYAVRGNIPGGEF